MSRAENILRTPILSKSRKEEATRGLIRFVEQLITLLKETEKLRQEIEENEWIINAYEIVYDR